MLRIWELSPDSNRHLCIQPQDLRYFWNHFNGERISDRWEIPPHEVLNRSKKLADFTSWQTLSAFLVSQRAKDMIASLDENAVEFLPFGSLKGQDLFAANVLRTEDYLDFDRTEFMSGANIPERIIWRGDLPDDLPPIFKVKGGAATYVTEPFGRMVVKLGLTGLRLADPSNCRLEQITNGETVNAFPGL